MSNEERATLQEDIGRLEGELAAKKLRFYSKPADPVPTTTALERWSWALWAFLLISVVASGVWAAGVIVRWQSGLSAELSLSVALGIFGAALSGLMSLNERVANGWEFDDGSREPDPAVTKERFNLRLSKGFFARPFLGLASGPLVLAGIKLGQFLHDAVPPTLIDERYRILFFCILGGLFSKTLFDWLKDVFKKLVGK
jgi:hypothetical protein